MNDTNALSFLETTFRAIYPQDFECRQQAEARLAQLAMPHWAGVSVRSGEIGGGIGRSLAD